MENQPQQPDARPWSAKRVALLVFGGIGALLSLVAAILILTFDAEACSPGECRDFTLVGEIVALGLTGVSAFGFVTSAAYAPSGNIRVASSLTALGLAGLVGALLAVRFVA